MLSSVCRKAFNSKFSISAQKYLSVSHISGTEHRILFYCHSSPRVPVAPVAKQEDHNTYKAEHLSIHWLHYLQFFLQDCLQAGPVRPLGRVNELLRSNSQKWKYAENLNDLRNRKENFE